MLVPMWYLEKANMLEITKNYSDILSDELKNQIKEYNKNIELLKTNTTKSAETPTYNINEQNSTYLNNMYIIARQSLLRRHLDIYSSFEELWNTEQLLSASILGRALYENLASLHYLNRGLEKAIVEKDYISAYKHIGSSLLSCRYKRKKNTNTFSDIRYPHIMDQLRELDKEIPIMDDYNWLSEFTHPNALGASLYYSTIIEEKDKVEFIDKPEIDFYTISNCLTAPITIGIFHIFYLKSEIISIEMLTTQWNKNKCQL